MTNKQYSQITLAEADRRFMLTHLLPSQAWYLEHEMITLFSGDLVLDGDLDLAYIADQKLHNRQTGIVVIDGDLTITGKASLDGLYALVVLGNLTCCVFEPQSCDIYISKDLNISLLFLAQAEDDSLPGEQIGVERISVHGMVNCPNIYTWHYRLFHLRLSAHSKEIITDTLPDYLNGIDIDRLMSKLSG